MVNQQDRVPRTHKHLNRDDAELEYARGKKVCVVKFSSSFKLHVHKHKDGLASRRGNLHTERIKK